MACRLFHAKPFPGPTKACYQLGHSKPTSIKFKSKCNHFHLKYFALNCLPNDGHFTQYIHFKNVYILIKLGYRVKGSSQANTINTGKWRYWLTHRDRVTHICVSILSTVGSDNGLSPGRRQAIIWTNAGIMLMEPMGISFNDNLIKIQQLPFKKLRLKMSSEWWRCCVSDSMC